MLEVAGTSTAQSFRLPRRGQDFITSGDVTAFLRRHCLLIGGCLVASLLAAGFYVLTTESIYVARTQMLIEPKIPELSQQSQSEVTLSLDTAQVESQIAVLQSEKIAAMVIEDLNLLQDASFNRLRDPGFGVRLQRAVEALGDATGLSESRGMRWLQARLDNPKLSTSGMDEFEQYRLTMAIFQGSLGVRRVGVSYAIEISFRSFGPEEAARVANATANAFVREQVQAKSEAAREGSAWLERRIRELRAQMNEATRLAQEFRARHDYGVTRRDDIEVAETAELGEGGEGEVMLEELEANAETYRKMYESFLEAFTNAVHRQSYPVADARVITPATRPLDPSHPRAKLAWALGALAGLMGGIGLAFAKHMLDRSVLSAHQIRDELGVECLGELPTVLGKRRGFGRLDEFRRSPRSEFGEGLRRIKAGIELAESERPIRSLGIISVSSGNGKSELVCNLAGLFARSGRRTLLLDGDPYHAELTKSMRATFAQEDHADHSQAVSPVRLLDMLSLDFVAARKADGSWQEGIEAKRLRSTLRSNETYDIIIVDLPPILTAADGLLLAPTLDAVIVVVERGKTRMDLLAELVRSLRSARAHVVGVVLTKSRTSLGKPVRRYHWRSAPATELLHGAVGMAYPGSIQRGARLAAGTATPAEQSGGKQRRRS